MKVLMWGLAAVMVLVCTGTVWAGGIICNDGGCDARYIDIDKYDGIKGIKLSAYDGNSYSGVFDITAAGIEGDVEYPWLPPLFPTKIEDKGGYVPGMTILDAQVTIWARDDLDISHEYLQIDLGGEDAGTFEVTFDIFELAVSGVVQGQINATGQLEYTLTATKGDFYVTYGALCVNAVPLPAPAMAGMLMLGSLGLIRKLRRR